MGKKGFTLAWVFGLFMLLTFTTRTAFATKWVEVTEKTTEESIVYINADSIIKEGNRLAYMAVDICKKHCWVNPEGITIVKTTYKVEVDLGPPVRLKVGPYVSYDANDRQIGEPYYYGSIWFHLTPSWVSEINLALSLWDKLE